MDLDVIVHFVSHYLWIAPGRIAIIVIRECNYDGPFVVVPWRCLKGVEKKD